MADQDPFRGLTVYGVEISAEQVRLIWICLKSSGGDLYLCVWHAMPPSTTVYDAANAYRRLRDRWRKAGLIRHVGGGRWEVVEKTDG